MVCESHERGDTLVTSCVYVVNNAEVLEQPPLLNTETMSGSQYLIRISWFNPHFNIMCKNYYYSHIINEERK